MERLRNSKIGRFYFPKTVKEQPTDKKNRIRVPYIINEENGQMIPLKKEPTYTAVVRTSFSPGLGRRIPVDYGQASMVHFIFEHQHAVNMTEPCDDDECHHRRYINKHH